MYNIFWGVIVFLLGTIIGSFLNVLIVRYPLTKGIVSGRSHCPDCNKTLQWWQLIPLFSYIFLLGKCWNCRKSISFQYPLVECLFGLILLILVPSFFEGSLNIGVIAVKAIMIALLVVLSVIDFRTFLLPDRYVLLLAIFTGIYVFFTGGDYVNRMYGLLLGGGFLFLLWVITRGQGLGFGDVKLMVVLGFLFGVKGTIVLLFLAFVAGGMVGVWLLARKQASMKTAIPFGPFLAGCAILILLYPELPNYLVSYLVGT